MGELFPRAGHASSPASVRSLELGAGTVRSAPGQAVLTHLPPRPLCSYTAASAWGSQGPPGPRHAASPQVPWSRQPRPAASRGGQHFLLTREGAGPRGWRGGARRPSERWGVCVGLRPLLQGKGRAAGVDGGGGAPHTQVLGEPGGCVRVSSHGALVGRGSSREAPPPAAVEGGSDLGDQPGVASPAPPPPPGPQPRSQQPRRLTVVTGPQGPRAGWPRMPCPHRRPHLARPGGW